VWLSVVDGIDGALAGVYERDFPRAAALLHSAADSARTVGMFDAALLSEAQLGLVLVLSGAVSDGLRLLDWATTAAVSGEIGDPSSAVAVCCLLTAACLSIRDLARAAEWSQYAWDLAADRGGGTLFDYPRTDRAALRILQGDWPGAEQDLRDVIEGTQGWSRPAALARLHLADLSRRRGRFEQSIGVAGRGQRVIGPRCPRSPDPAHPEPPGPRP
jgi:hypothetical protein